jgi:drug/metabolite transporter (DMT)-like permease
MIEGHVPAGPRGGPLRMDKSVAALLVAMIIWGATYVVTKVALPHMGPFTILLIRLVLGTAALLPFAWSQGYRPRLALKKEFVLFGLTGMVLHLGFEILGLRFTSASSAVLIIATAPVVTVAFSVALLGERVNRRQTLGIALSIAGVVLLTGARGPDGFPLAWLGNLLVFAGVVTWGIFTVQGKRMAADHSWLVSTTAATSAAILLTIPLAVAEMAIEGAPHVTAGGIAAVVYLGVFAQAIAYGLWNFALERVDASVAGPYVNLVPVIGVVLALAVGETLSPLQLAGGITVALGVWLNHRGGTRSSRLREEEARVAELVPEVAVLERLSVGALDERAAGDRL